MLTALAVTMY